jgi:RNA polymerase sigma-70 factor (ECF subfamily)
MRGRCLALDYLRRRKRLSGQSIPEDLPSRQDLEAQFLLDEQKQALNRALTQLPEDMRQALHLIYFEDLSYAEAALVMKRSTKQVDNLLYRGKQQLRTILQKEGVEL